MSDALLLFRMGDFYEMFRDDAKTAARVLNLALTSREKGEKRRPDGGLSTPSIGELSGQTDRRGNAPRPCANRSKTQNWPRASSAAR